MVRKRKEVYVRDPTVSSDSEEGSSVSGMSDVIERKVHDAPAAPAVPPPSKQPLSYSFFYVTITRVYFWLLEFFFGAS